MGDGMSPDKLLTADDVADLLRIKVATVYAATRTGDLPHIRLGRSYRYKAEDVDRFIERRRMIGKERAPAASAAVYDAKGILIDQKPIGEEQAQ